MCAVGVERIVRIFILAARLFHSQLRIVFSSAESGRICGQADLHIFYPNVEVHLRRTLCDVRCNALFAHILLAVWLLTPKIQFFLFLPPNQAASAARRHLHIFCANVSVQVRRLVRRNLQRLVGIFILAVHALALSEIVAARSMLFAGGWWRIHFTCGNPYILIPTSRVSGPDTLWRVRCTRLNLL